MRTLTLFLMLACSPDHPAKSACREGTSLADDGHCYPDLPTDLDAALRALPACEPVLDDGLIELASGCASGACPGMTYDEINRTLSERGRCLTASWSETALYCDWSLGLDGVFDDDDRDGQPDPDTSNTTDRIHLFPPYAHGTRDGLGVGASPACFVDALLLPDSVDLVRTDSGLQIRSFSWDNWGLTAYDDGTDDRSGLPNGAIDQLYLYGAP